MAHLPISKTFAYNKSCSSIFVRGAFFFFILISLEFKLQKVILFVKTVGLLKVAEKETTLVP